MKQPSLPRLFLYMLIINSRATAIKCRRNAVTNKKHNRVARSNFRTTDYSLPLLALLANQQFLPQRRVSQLPFLVE